MVWLTLLGQADAPPSFLYGGWVPLVVIGALFYFMLVRPERRKRAEMTEMLNNLKKNDRVITSGGIYGTVVNVQKSSEDVTIKVDETNNTKLRVLRSAILRVTSENARTSEKRDSD